MQVQGDEFLQKVGLSRAAYTGEHDVLSKPVVLRHPNTMIAKSTLLFLAPLVASVLADGDYPWQAPSSTDRKLIFRFDGLGRLYSHPSRIICSGTKL